MAGYTRQATANIQSGKVIYAEDLNAEYNALAAAFSGSTGHSHDGSTGNGPKINLVNSVEGVLPLAMGGTGASNASGARTAIGAHNASNLTTGTLPSGRLSGNYSFGSLTLSGDLTMSGGRISNAVHEGLGGLTALPPDNDLSKLSLTHTTFFNADHDTLDRPPFSGRGHGIHWQRASGGGEAQLFIRESPGGERLVFRTRVTEEWGEWREYLFPDGDGSRLTNLNASNITSGTLPANRLPNHSAALLTSGTLPSGRLSGNYSFGSLTLSGNLNLTSGHIAGDAAQILTNPGGWTVRTENNSSNYILSVQSSGGAERFKVVHGAPLLKGDSTGWSVDGAFTATTISGTLSGNGSGITNINASNISSGTLNEARIPNLNASKVTAGTFHVDRIPALPASKITSGTFAADRIPSLNASILGSGTVPAARLSGNYSFGSLTLSGGLTTGGNIVSGGNIQVNSNSIYIRSDSTKHLWFRDSTDTSLGALYLGEPNGQLVLRVHDASGSSVHQLALERNGHATFTGAIYGNGEGLTNLNASNISSGTLPAARLPNHSADLLTSGTLPNARLNGNYSFGSLTLSGSLTAASVSGNGSGLTNLNASNISSGTLPAARLPNHSAALLTSGTLPAGRLSGSYSFGSLTLSGGLTTGGNIQVNSNSIYIRSDSTKHLWFRDSTDTSLGVLYLDQSDGRLVLRVHDASGSSVHQLELRRDGRATFTGALEVGGNPVATVSTTGSASTTTFPVGHTVLAHKGQYNRNSSQTLRIEDNRYYRVGGSGDALSGTWRARGAAYVHNAQDITVFQRVA